MTIETLGRTLARGLARPLPGPDGQARMAPRPRFGWRPGRVPENSRHNGVLVLLFPLDGTPHVVLTVRHRDLQHHAGQVSFPGGAVEAGEDPQQASLREAEEEVGLDPDGIRIVGRLSPLHVPVSGNVLHPHVGITRVRPVLRADLREVERILEVPLDHLADPDALGVERRVFEDRPVDVPFFRLEGEKVWGATAMVLSELLCVLGRPPDPWTAR